MESHLILSQEDRENAINRALRFLQHLPADRTWEVIVKPWKRTRSSQQNRYLWGVVYPTILAADQLQGWTAEDLHEYFLGEHFGWETVQGFGKKRIRPIRRSSRLDKMEFADYIAYIQRTMAESGVYIPDPDEQI